MRLRFAPFSHFGLFRLPLDPFFLKVVGVPGMIENRFSQFPPKLSSLAVRGEDAGVIAW